MRLNELHRSRPRLPEDLPVSCITFIQYVSGHDEKAGLNTPL